MFSKFFLLGEKLKSCSNSFSDQENSLKQMYKTCTAIQMHNSKFTPHKNRIHSQSCNNSEPCHQNLSETQTNLQYANDFSFFLPENEIKSFVCTNRRSKLDKAVQTSFDSENMTKNKPSKRWIIVFCDIFINISKFYCMDSALALQTFFYSGKFNLSSTQYNLFYSIFAYLFMLTFFSGYFVEKIGVRFSLFFFCLLCFIGHFFFTFGATYQNYSLMLFGRLIFGVACYSVEICQDILLTEWFFNKELAFSVGVGFASCRLGSALTNLITPKIIAVASVFEALLIGLILSFLGLICSIFMVIIDRNFEEEKGDKEVIDSFLHDYSFLENGLDFNKLKELGILFWILVINAMLVYACYFGFVNNSMDILCTLYGYSTNQAGELVTLMFFSASLSPIFGFLVDKFGKRMKILVILLVLLNLPFINFFFFDVNVSKDFVIISLISIGFFFASYGLVLWSSFALIVDGNKKCMAFAIIYASLNISLIISSIYIGVSFDYGKDSKDQSKYHWSFISMVICLCVSICLVLKISLNEPRKISALNSFDMNQKIREIVNEDLDLGQKLLEIMDQTEKEFEMKPIK